MKKHEELFMRIINLNLMVLGQLPPIPKLTLTQTLTLTRGQFSSGAIVWLPLNPKTNPNLDRNPNPNREAIFLGEGTILRILNLMGYWKRNIVSVSIIEIFKR